MRPPVSDHPPGPARRLALPATGMTGIALEFDFESAVDTNALPRLLRLIS